jgi:4-diphosphocytidyl-2-C-methyl-D-erythritol kinase
MKEITLSAPAKINTILRIVGRRPNGYHDLAMVMEKLDLKDELTLEAIPEGIELEIDGESDSGMAAQGNLVWKAAAALSETAGIDRGVKIRLKKQIPVAAGLGGGSSDAASTLMGLNRLWDLDWSDEQLAKLGAKLGADVPFFCYEGTAIVEGIGDRIISIPKLPKLFILLINPGFAVSTKWVYDQYDALGEHPVSGIGHREQLTVDGGDVRLPRLFETFRDVTANLVNDLEKATVPAYPELEEIKKYLTESGAEGVLMAGSGPTVFGLFQDKEKRDLAANNIPKGSWKAFATEN